MRFKGVRRVLSGSYPLYRLIVVGIFLSAVLQLVTGRLPRTVAHMTHGLTVTYECFLIFQILGAVMIVASFALNRALLSLQVERIGAIALTASCAIYVASAWIFGGVATSPSTWTMTALMVYLVWRITLEIPKEVRGVVQAAQSVADRRT